MANSILSLFILSLLCVILVVCLYSLVPMHSSISCYSLLLPNTACPSPFGAEYQMSLTLSCFHMHVAHTLSVSYPLWVVNE